MLKTIRSQLLAFSFLALLVTAVIGATGSWSQRLLNTALNNAVVNGTAMRNHLQTDMLHDGLRGDVEAYKGAVSDKQPERIKAVGEDLRRHAKDIRAEFAKNKGAPTFGAALQSDIVRVAGLIELYAKNAEQMLEVDPGDLAALEQHRAITNKQFLVLEHDLAKVRVAIEILLEASQGQGHAATQQAAWLMAAAMLLGACALAVAGWLLYRRVSKSLKRLVRTLKALNSGDYAARAQLKTGDELGAVGAALDKLLDDRLEALSVAAKESETLSASVLEIIQAVAEVAGGKDLSIRVPVTSDVTGAIGDAMNMLTHETAKVLGKVSRVSLDVSSATQLVKQSSDSAMSAASQNQTEVEHAARELSLTATTLNELARLAQRANESAETSVRTTRQALATVDRTVKGINESRDLIRETEKRIKRLGERSQEINQVVSLINSIAERTGILALNASMQSVAAGEAGRGFAIVAEEVKRLSENAREATREIATLVTSIQSETSETVLAMNSAISQVVDVSRLADQAGNEMKGTQQATDDLAASVRGIAATSIEQARTGQSLQARAESIQKSSRDTASQLHSQGEITTRLVVYAQALVQAAAVFKLPRRRVAAE